MRLNKFLAHLPVAAMILVFVLFASNGGAANRERVIHSFNNDHKDGVSPVAGLIIDPSGNLYGTTQQGGPYNEGTVFELMPKTGGGWSEAILHQFNPDGSDGVSPYAGLIVDSSGNLYGTTLAGGAYSCGTVFELSPSNGGWTEHIIHDFNPNNGDGLNPVSGLIMDKKGILYGTTQAGGDYNAGVVFQMTPSGGNWTETVLHDFNPDGADGIAPFAGLAIDRSGHLYGTTYQGGVYDVGTVFQLSPKKGGNWTEKVLHTFNSNGAGGTNPVSSLILDSAGNLFGTTSSGGKYGAGVAFELLPKAGGKWIEKTLHDFNPDNKDGANPRAGLFQDSLGNLYGTTQNGGSSGTGTAFRLGVNSGGKWSEKVLHSFSSSTDGKSPESGLVSDKAGNLYGTTQAGGANNSGTVFGITP